MIRSELVLNDHDGELITTVVQNGRPDKGMPKFDLSSQDIATIAAFIHSMPVGGRAATTGTVNALVGDAKAGEAYFNGPENVPLAIPCPETWRGSAQSTPT